MVAGFARKMPSRFLPPEGIFNALYPKPSHGSKARATADSCQWRTIQEPEDYCPLGLDSLLPTQPRIWYAFGLPVKSLVPMAGLTENAQRPVLALAALSPPGQDLP